MAKEVDLKHVDLKVFVNCCEGCKRKVLKALSIKGVLRVEIHPTQPKVTVIGDVDIGVLIKKLSKVGKSAQVLDETAQTPQEKANPEKIKNTKSKEDNDKYEEGKGGPSLSEAATEGMNPTIVTPIPQMNSCLTMVPQAQVYCVPMPYYAMTVHPTPVTYYVQDYRHCETLAYHPPPPPPPPPQSQSMATFGDYFDEDNTTGCQIM